MSGIDLTSLRAEYEELFRTCSLRAEHQGEAEALARKILAHRADYEAVGGPLGIPWQFIGVVHCMEAGLRFDRHLHNGDSLKARTVQVPAGRPVEGTPPFAWHDSARDALVYEKLDRRRDWSLAGTLHCLEGYNGWGYRKWHPGVLSPYLWSFTNHYRSGKYVADGTWDGRAVSRQCGAAALLLVLAQQGSFDVAVPPPSEPLGPARPLIAYYTGGPESEPARKLQILLNDVLGTSLAIDGKPGSKTSDAVERLVGHKLLGDPRA